MDKYRPVKWLVREVIKGQGKAEVATKKSLKHILWMASRAALESEISASFGCYSAAAYE